jgi:predicted MPP superfamily phosphohydrolase
MKILILHLSDIHINETAGQLLPYTTLIKKSLQTLLDSDTIDFILIVVTGDIAWSGRNVEYENACLFINKLASLYQALSRSRGGDIP